MSAAGELITRFDDDAAGPSVEYREDGVVVVLLDRPGRLNALTPSLMARLTVRLEGLAADPDVRAVVLTGANGAFSAGAELSAIEPAAALPEAELEVLLARIMRMSETLWLMPQPTIAAIDGPAAGGAMALALACDVRVAGPTAALVSPFIHMGMVPDCGLSWLLPRLVGEGRALEIMLSGRPVGAVRGERLGLFTEVTDDPLVTALDLAATFARRPRAAVRATKQLLRDVADGSLGGAIDDEARAQAAAMHGPEFNRTIGRWKASRRPE